jgi:hypothetical protein
MDKHKEKIMEDAHNALLIVNSLTQIEKTQLINTLQDETSDTALQWHLIYIKPRLPTCYFHIPSMVMLANACEEEAKSLLNEMGNMLRVPSERQWMAMGKIKNEAEKLATRLNTSIIFSGSTEHKHMTKHLRLRRAGSGCNHNAISGLGSWSAPQKAQSAEG